MLCQFCKGDTVTSVSKNAITNIEVVRLICRDCDSRYDTKTDVWEASTKANRIVEAAMHSSRLDEID